MKRTFGQHRQHGKEIARRLRDEMPDELLRMYDV